MKGSMTKRGNSWRLRVDGGIGPDHKRIQRTQTFRGNKREAQSALVEMVAQISTGRDFSSKGLTVADYLDRWLQSKHDLKRRTRDGYRTILDLHVLPVIGSTKLAKLSPLHVEAVLAEAEAKRLSARTRLHIHRCLFGALKQAVRWRLIPSNPAEGVAVPRARSRQITAMTPEAAKAIMEALAGTDLYVPALLGLGCGLRLGEALGLRWSDTDLDTGIVTIRQTLSTDRRFETPKNHRTRVISMQVEVVAALREHRKEQLERRLLCGEGWVDEDLVVDNGNGFRTDSRSVSRRFRAAMTTAGVDCSFHALRHGFATLSLRAGVDLKTTQERLGHSSMSITADLYSHVAKDVEQEAASKLGALIF